MQPNDKEHKPMKKSVLRFPSPKVLSDAYSHCLISCIESSSQRHMLVCTSPRAEKKPG